MAKHLRLIRQNYAPLLLKFSSKNSFRNYAKVQPKKNDPYILTRALPIDYDETIDLMWQAYYPSEPTISSLGLGEKRNSVLDEMALRCLAEGVSVVAKCKYTGKIVGACLNESAVPWDADEKERIACRLSCERIQHILYFWAHVQKAPDLWKQFDVQKVLELSHLFVKKSDRGQGLAKKLLIKSVDSALDAGYSLVRVDATNYYTAKICKQLNFRLVYELPYCAYMGADNRPIFNPSMPHRSVKACAILTGSFVNMVLRPCDRYLLDQT